jgi:hypothetical protein
VKRNVDDECAEKNKNVQTGLQINIWCSVLILLLTLFPDPESVIFANSSSMSITNDSPVESPLTAGVELARPQLIIVEAGLDSGSLGGVDSSSACLLSVDGEVICC